MDTPARNPFHHWIEEDAHKGVTACAIYETAVQALDAIPSHANPVGAAQPILHAMIIGFNDLDDVDFCMDTIRREEAGDVFADLAERAGVPAEVSDVWFDEWRDF